MKKFTGKPNKRHKEKETEPKKPKRRQAPGKTIESRENQLISDAIELAAKQIRLGTVSSQVLSHFVKLGSTTALLEKAKLEKELQLVAAKTDEIKSRKKIEELYANAMKAFGIYRGVEEEEPQDDEDG
jgi:hypothetical protein